MFFGFVFYFVWLWIFLSVDYKSVGQRSKYLSHLWGLMLRYPGSRTDNENLQSTQKGSDGQREKTRKNQAT